jgi:hypothetical protein
MKRTFTILITAVLIASGMHVSIDRHYCGGTLADVKLSFTGKLASCGMEQAESDCRSNPVFDQKCCEDQISYLNISTNYFPEFSNTVNPVYEKDIILIQSASYLTPNSYFTGSDIIVLPPGDKIKPGLTQPEICVFRI